MTFEADIWHAGSSTKVKVMYQNSRSHDEKCSFYGCGWSRLIEKWK